ncbi:MAG TPA: alpha/beta hydrolase [Candidatus Acidoferrales bacterium]|jgi:acetyl esterase/lipase|nr:alpha/beta hydrolase [Candidatus Acidoferrales bacterium]
MRFRFLKRLSLSLAALFLLTTSCLALEFRKHGPSAVTARVQSDVVYSHAAGQDLKLDLYFPTNAAGARLPVVMYVHGGGWQLGNKEMLGLMPGPVELLRRNYLVVSADYRLAPDNKFPAMLEDAKCAVRFLRAHAKEFNLDPNRIGVMGDSAGGHLVALLGLTDASAGFEGAGWTNESSRVQAVVDLYGPSDLLSGPTNNQSSIKIIKAAFGATNALDPVLVRGSPVTYVTSNAPPFLILHGNRDQLVSLQQSVELNDRLKAVGADSTLVVITNFAHGYTPFWLKSSPTTAELSRRIADFFDKHL